MAHLLFQLVLPGLLSKDVEAEVAELADGGLTMLMTRVVEEAEELNRVHAPSF
jgi:hypothetical protein